MSEQQTFSIRLDAEQLAAFRLAISLPRLFDQAKRGSSLASKLDKARQKAASAADLQKLDQIAAEMEAAAREELDQLGLFRKGLAYFITGEDPDGVEVTDAQE